MLAFFYNFQILLAASGGEGGGGFMDFYNKYLNYPGLEAWKFVNLAIFVAVLAYLLRKPLGEAFKARREAIRAPSTMARSLAQATSGCTSSPAPDVPKPQSVPAITRSRPTTSAKRTMRCATSSGCSTR